MLFFLQCIVTPGTKNSNQILRVKVTPKDIAAVGRVPVYYHNSVGMTAVVFEKLHNFKAEDPTAYLDVLWKSSILFGSPRPAWSGMMQLVHCGSIPGKSSVMFLPMIDINPSDTSCITPRSSTFESMHTAMQSSHLTSHSGGKL